MRRQCVIDPTPAASLPAEFFIGNIETLCAEIGCAPHLSRIKYLINAKVIFIHLSTVNVLFVSSQAKILLPVRSSSGGSNSPRAQLLKLCSCCSQAFHLSLVLQPRMIRSGRPSSLPFLWESHIYTFCKMHWRIRCSRRWMGFDVVGGLVRLWSRSTDSCSMIHFNQQESQWPVCLQ